MRLLMTGGATGPYIPDPVVISYVFAGTDTFDRDAAIEQGFTDYEVIAIGGAGGSGGSFFRSSDFYHFYGGGGGGGGSHRVAGKLIDLPSIVPVVVGAKGANATSSSGDQNGGDGGVSSFGDTLCRASGGKGGLTGTSSGVRGAGGVGGIGNSGTAGGGPSYASGSGTWDGTIGSGGAGGAGSVMDGWAGQFVTPSVPGRAGAHSASDSRFSAPGEEDLYPGGPGGGAKATPINGSEIAFGTNGPGAVFIRLTANYEPPVLDPLVVFEQPGSFTLDTQPYRDYGYTNFDVIVIGGAGGIAGESRKSLIGGWFGGGGGGGGGIQRVQGLLSSLPTSVPVVVGAGGANGAWSDTAQGTNGTDGGFSTFNGTTARASGGKGAVLHSGLEPGQQGGDGGVGGQTTAGGAGNGGWDTGSNVGIYNPTTGIGAGGGGGFGGAVWDSSGLNSPSPASRAGGNTTGQTEFNVTGGGIGTASGHRRANNGGGAGAGYKAKPLTGSDKAYGTGGVESPTRTKNGVVVVKFS